MQMNISKSMESFFLKSDIGHNSKINAAGNVHAILRRKIVLEPSFCSFFLEGPEIIPRTLGLRGTQGDYLVRWNGNTS